MKARFLAMLVLVPISCSGCCTIMCGDDKTVSIRSNPSGADFEIKNRSGTVVIKDTTPNIVTLKRGGGWFQKADYTIRLEKEGYEPMVTKVDQNIEAGWYFGGNFVFGGLIGWLIVDPATGAMWNIKDVDVSLKPPAIIQTTGGTKKLIGYRGTINTATGKPETTPVYEDEK